MFQQAYSRVLTAPALNLVSMFNGSPLTREQLAQIEMHLHKTTSTYVDLLYFLQSDIAESTVDIISWLYSRHGWLCPLRQHCSCGDQGESADDSFLERRLVHWRGFMLRLQTELPAIYRSCALLTSPILRLSPRFSRERRTSCRFSCSRARSATEI
ncbi:hypothetical protein VTO42DRAFT_772 [Malbranchea cinnamomea]